MVNNYSFHDKYKEPGNFVWSSYNPVTYRKLIDRIPDWSDKNIMIVEDDETNAYLLKAYLKKTNATILEVRDGQKAVDLCNSKLKIDLVLMDIRLPVLNGYDATQLIKSKNKDLIIIAQTAFARKADVDCAFKAGCDDFLSKPISQEQLFEVISKYLG